MPKKSFAIISLGCFRNTYDSEIVVYEFMQNGYILKDEPKDANVVVINTCGFIDKAKKESIEVIQDIVDLKNEGKIKEVVVFGCLVKRYLKELQKRFPEVDQWRQLKDFLPPGDRRHNLKLPHVDFLKISEGCANRCAYCAIPLIKGPLRSRPLSHIIEEAKFLEKRGVKELHIIGQDITSWGKDLKKSQNLIILLRKLLKETKKIHWIRLMYTHPKYVTEELIDLIAKEERICNYIDLPIQHINDRILKIMKRNTTKGKIKKIINIVREKIPQGVIRTSVMVGFPTETSKEFDELCEFISETKFERLGTFIYSREENTPAYSMKPQIHHQTKINRYNTLMKLQQGIVENINQSFIGRDLEVLIEEKCDGGYFGRTEFDAYEVDGGVFINKKDLKVGQFYKANIVDAYEYDLVGV